MPFIENAEAVAHEIMMGINPRFADPYSKLIKFLVEFPTAASALKNIEVGTIQYIQTQANAFARSRNAISPIPPKTIPDEMVSVILRDYFDIPEGDLEKIKIEHSLSMGAENIVGNLLERYLAMVMEPRGWIWCSGSIIRAADFLKPPSAKNQSWELLQVKNRSNSENSSSSAIRIGTSIQKWHRTFAYKKALNWQAFPDKSIVGLISEDDFKKFVSDYLQKIKSVEI